MATEGTNSQLLLYKTSDGLIRVEVRLDRETVWLSLAQLSELFQRDKSVISRHIRSIFASGELSRDSVVAFFATTAADGKQYNVEYFNLELVIAVGYRVNSNRGIIFRNWASQRLKEYIVKGFTIDSVRLKNANEGNYFEELLSVIRDIRSSEKVFWRKVLEIYSTSIDYDPKNELTLQFFKSVQNKMHWAAHGNTAAEIIHQRADSTKQNMGLTNFLGSKPRKSEVVIAKNYLYEDELNVLNRIVNAYLEFAEIQALNQTPMYMKDWALKLDDFLKLSGRELLEHAGRISNEQARIKAEKEYEAFRANLINENSQVEKHFEQVVKSLPKPQKSTRGKKD